MNSSGRINCPIESMKDDANVNLGAGYVIVASLWNEIFMVDGMVTAYGRT